MAGILDAKTRILDAVVTEIGRSQISTGRLKVEYASLTDSAAYYEDDGNMSPTDASSRIYFESPGYKKQDFITFETDDSGALIGYPVDARTSIIGNEVFQEDPGSSDLNSLLIISSSNFASVADGIVTSSIDHWKEIRPLGTLDDQENLSRSFETNISKCDFMILNTFPFEDGAHNNIVDVNELSSLFLDDRLSHLPNFKFLPPLVVEPPNDVFEFTEESLIDSYDPDGGPGTLASPFLGDYSPLSRTSEIQYSDIMKILNGSESEGVDLESFSVSEIEPMLPWFSEDSVLNESPHSSTSTQVTTERSLIEFTKTSMTNNLVMQIFETDSRKIKFSKLDVIDFGEFTVDNKRPSKRVFFVGKVFVNDYQVPAFANLFTIIMD